MGFSCFRKSSQLDDYREVKRNIEQYQLRSENFNSENNVLRPDCKSKIDHSSAIQPDSEGINKKSLFRSLGVAKYLLRDDGLSHLPLQSAFLMSK